MNPNELDMMINLPLEIKIGKAKLRIREWYEHFDGEVYVSFSGGKDSTVLLHLIREIYPEVPAVFINTGLEYPEIVKFVKTIDNVIFIKPELTFKQTIDKYGYPVISKEQSRKINQVRNQNLSDRYLNKILNGDERGGRGISLKWQPLIKAPFNCSDSCCDVMKKRPAKKFEKETGLKPYIGTMATDSRLRRQKVIREGCNSFGTKRKVSKPLSIWKESDIWEYIRLNNLPYSDIYNKGYDRTGCMFCMFGIQMEEEPNRFQRMKETHPKIYNYCMNNLGLSQVLDYINIPY